jgi:hypothetical protein
MIKKLTFLTCPRNDGSVKLSVYPTIPVEKTTSPLTGVSAPKEMPKFYDNE